MAAFSLSSPAAPLHGKLPCERSSIKSAAAHVTAFYMASCQAAMEYRFRLLRQGPGRIFLTEDLHPACNSLTAPPIAV